MRPALFLHLLFVGVWIGCVMVETVIERSLWSRKIAPQLHYVIDRWVEIPAFSIVLITGFWMFELDRFRGWYAVKVVCGSIAVATNIYCVLPVTRRRAAAESENKTEVRRYSRQIYYTLLVGLPAALIALGIGIHLLVIF